ncbi:MAG: PIN domain-containing protein [Terracidiphilus sp.]
MTRYLLDSSILRSILDAHPSAPLAAWLDAQADESIYISSMNLAEIWNGILALASGEQRQEKEVWFAGPRGPRVVFGNRVLTFDDKAAMVWGRLVSERGAAGLSCAPVDMIYAAIAEANDCVLVTDNEERFTGLNVLNPMKPGG